MPGTSNSFKFGEEPFYPMVGFFFTIGFSGITAKVDCKFKDVSGIKMKLVTEEIKSGGDNGIVITLPKKTTYTDLTLKRGVLSANSEVTKWCYSWFLNDYNGTVQTKDIELKLLDETGTSVMGWMFHNALPIEMDISGFNSMSGGDSAILVETIVFKYTHISLL
jgi:phage tail-like protein